MEAGAFNDLGRRRLFDFWPGFERKHGAADEERRRAEFSVGGLRVPTEVKTALTENGAKRRRERVAGSEKKASQSRGRVRRTSDNDSAIVQQLIEHRMRNVGKSDREMGNVGTSNR